MAPSVLVAQTRIAATSRFDVGQCFGLARCASRRHISVSLLTHDIGTPPEYGSDLNLSCFYSWIDKAGASSLELLRAGYQVLHAQSS